MVRNNIVVGIRPESPQGKSSRQMFIRNIITPVGTNAKFGPGGPGEEEKRDLIKFYISNDKKLLRSSPASYLAAPSI